MEEKTRDENNKKILIISIWGSAWSMGEGAGVSDDYHFIKKAKARGFSVHFLGPKVKNENSGKRDCIVDSYPDFFGATAWLPSWIKRFLWLFLFQIFALPKALYLAGKIRPDFILGHSHYTTLATFLSGKLAGARTGIKLFGVMELGRLEWNRCRYFYKNFEQIICLRIPQDVWFILDDGTRGKDAAVGLGIPEEKIRFLPNGVNVEWAGERHDREDIRLKADLPLDPPIVLFLARLVKSKRPEHFIRAIPGIIANSKIRPFFLFVGDGPLRGRCEELSRKLGVSPFIRFFGAVKHSEVPSIMSACDVFVSTSNLTNMALPTCEAFLCGLPAVAYDVADTKKVVVDGETGLLVPDGDIDSLAKAIAKLINNTDLRKRMGSNARTFAMNNFTGWHERTNTEIDMISSLINKTG